MEGGFQTATKHANRFVNVTLTVNLVLLREHMDDFFTWHHDQLVHVVRQAQDVLIFNDLLRFFSGDVIAVLQRANMLTRNAYGH